MFNAMNAMNLNTFATIFADASSQLRSAKQPNKTPRRTLNCTPAQSANQ
jgi:hypothetical protein